MADRSQKQLLWCRPSALPSIDRRFVALDHLAARNGRPSAVALLPFDCDLMNRLGDGAVWIAAHFVLSLPHPSDVDAVEAFRVLAQSAFRFAHP